ncbi:MAG TPA: CBS domain-containing protein, partial [Allocoleopsis sp.]
GSVRAPLTAILLLFELTHDYRIVLPLMAAVGLSIWLVEYLHSQVVIDNTPEPEPLAEASPPPALLPLAVTEAMQPVDLRLAGSLSLTEAAQLLITQRCHSALVVDNDEQTIGIITLRDVHRFMAKVKSADDTESLMQQPIQELCTTDLIYAYTDESVTEAVIRMSARGLQQLPVVNRDQPQQVIGLLTQENIALAHSIAKTRDALHRRLDSEALDSEALDSEALEAENPGRDSESQHEPPEQGDELNPKATVPTR